MEPILIQIKANKELPDKVGYYIACNDKGFIDSFGHDIIDESFYWWMKPVSIDELLPSKGENSIIENICYSSIIKDDDLDADTIEEGVKLGIKQGIKFYINFIKSKLTEK